MVAKKIAIALLMSAFVAAGVHAALKRAGLRTSELPGDMANAFAAWNDPFEETLVSGDDGAGGVAPGQAGGNGSAQPTPQSLSLTIDGVWILDCGRGGNGGNGANGVVGEPGGQGGKGGDGKAGAVVYIYYTATVNVQGHGPHGGKGGNGGDGVTTGGKGGAGGGGGDAGVVHFTPQQGGQITTQNWINPVAGATGVPGSDAP